jgi:hypothetical protein
VRRGLPRLERHGAAAVAVVAVVVLGGCGSDDSGSAESGSTSTGGSTWSVTVANNMDAKPDGEVGQALKAITEVLGGADRVAACETYATTNYVTTAFGDIDGCKAAISAGASSKGLEISTPDISGDSATSIVTPQGGPSAGEKIHVTLVKDGDVWKVDTAKANVPVGP